MTSNCFYFVERLKKNFNANFFWDVESVPDAELLPLTLIQTLKCYCKGGCSGAYQIVDM